MPPYRSYAQARLNSRVELRVVTVGGLCRRADDPAWIPARAGRYVA